MKITVVLLALLVCTMAYEFQKPKNGTELEVTLRSELDDIWVIEWYQNQNAGGAVDCSKVTASNADCDCKASADGKTTTCTPKAAPAAQPAQPGQPAPANQPAGSGAPAKPKKTPQ